MNKQPTPDLNRISMAIYGLKKQIYALEHRINILETLISKCEIKEIEEKESLKGYKNE